MLSGYDVIIVGTGVAGLYAALHIDKRYKVLLISKRELVLSNSVLAQGGVAAVVDKEHDTNKLHLADTLIAGGYKNNLSALQVLVTEGPDDVLHLVDLGVEFDEDMAGHLQMTLEAGHSRNRIMHHKDSTGREISEKLIMRVKEKSNIDIMENTMICRIIKADSGFYADMLKDGEIITAAVKFCMLATGGIGRVYRYTTNSAIATGDGIALAYHMGAAIRNLHYIQFHPTAFAAESGRECFLISEAVRGEGAVLLNCDGERFMHRYDKRLELAPRDVVSRSIMSEARRTGSSKFYLDISFKDAEFIKNRFPMIYGRCLEEGYDMTTEKVPIFPCQHYLMGGISVDLQAETEIKGLYAIGECSHTGVHGLNRLASNSLLEALVFSRRAAFQINSLMDDMPEVSGEYTPIDISGQPIPKGLRTQIRDIMQSAYFVHPNEIAMREGLIRISQIYEILTNSKYEMSSDYIEALSLASSAKIVLESALKAGQEEADVKL